MCQLATTHRSKLSFNSDPFSKQRNDAMQQTGFVLEARPVISIDDAVRRWLTRK